MQTDKPESSIPPWNPYLSTCPTRQVLDCVADKWAVLIIGLLIAGPRRFGAIRRDIQGVSQKMLTQTLRALERDGLVLRTAFEGASSTVEYSLTPLGASLSVTLDQLRIWAQLNIEAVIQSREAYDERAGTGA